MKVIFLDIDGVLTSARTGWHNFDIYAVSFLKWICELCQVKLVISSSWRHSTPKQFFDEIFPDLIHDDWKTKSIRKEGDRNFRGTEIKEWLTRHPEIVDYLILDDDSDMLRGQKKHFIKCDSYNGLQFKQMLKITDYFTGNKLSVYNGDRLPLTIHPNMFRLEVITQ